MIATIHYTDKPRERASFSTDPLRLMLRAEDRAERVMDEYGAARTAKEKINEVRALRGYYVSGGRT